jgi:hypothetical protein
MIAIMKQELGPWQVRELPEDIGYTIRGRLLNDARAEVQAFERVANGPAQYRKRGSRQVKDWVGVDGLDDAHRFLSGSIKWDGCFDVRIEPEDGASMPHFCGRKEAVAVGALFDALYDLACDLLGPSCDLD